MNHKDTKDTKTHEEFRTAEAMRRANEISRCVIGAAIEVHRILGPGLLESIYELALLRELSLEGVRSERQVILPMTYKGSAIPAVHRIDILVEGLVILELKSVTCLEPLHTSQLLTYLRISGRWLGLILNFNTIQLRAGIKRVLND
jgi:GxxExxY protein